MALTYRGLSFKARKYKDLHETWTLYRYDRYNDKTIELGEMIIDKKDYYDYYLKYNDKTCHVSMFYGADDDCFRQDMEYYFMFNDNNDMIIIIEQEVYWKDVYITVSENASFKNNENNRLKQMNKIEPFIRNNWRIK